MFLTVLLPTGFQNCHAALGRCEYELCINPVMPRIFLESVVLMYELLQINKE